jgi:hypothetical protein
VEAAEKAGIRRSASECFAFRTPLMLGGEFALSNVVAWDVAKYQVGTSKVLQQVYHLPAGTRVSVKPS